MSKIARSIARLRKQRDFSQEKLARLAGVSNNTLVNIDAGKNSNPTIATLRKIARALRVKVDDML